MNMDRPQLILPIIIFLVLFSFFVFREQKKIKYFIENTWSFKMTKWFALRRILYLLGMGLLTISLLDFRGPEQKIESNIPDQKTIIVIDSSASMLAEDVRPNRFKKSLLMARHFVKKAYGHRVAVVLFSDTQKRLVPFTDDLDLLDARIAGLESLDISNGGSNIIQAIKESLSYFKIDSGNSEEFNGNLLVFTDSEGHDEDLGIKVPSGVSVAIVGVGTRKGAPVPFRDRYGVFRGYKKYEGKEVVSRLNEDWLKKLSKKISDYHYWVANSYTIPTEEILAFFNQAFKKNLNRGQATVKPVVTHYTLIPALLLLMFSFLLYPLRNFKVCSFLIPLLLFYNVQTKANEMIEKLEAQMRAGELTGRERLGLAELYLQNQAPEKARTLYEESRSELGLEDRSNYALSLMQSEETEKALEELSQLQEEIRSGQINATEEQKETIRKNMLSAFQEKQKQDKKKEEEKKENDKENKENKKKSEKGDSQKGQSKKENQKNGDPSEKGEKKPNEKKDGEEDQKEKEKKKDTGEDGEKKEEKQDKNQPQSLEEKQKDIELKKKMIKVPGLIKQLMSDDRGLQKKYLDTSTEEPRKIKKKDW